MEDARTDTTQTEGPGEQEPPMVEIRQLVKQFGEVRAVMLKNADIGAIGTDQGALFLFALVMICLSSLTTRRRLA